MTQTLPAPGVETALPAPATAAPGGGDLLNLMLDGHPRTRADLIELTGLARSTVAGRIEGLLSVGLLQPSGQSRSTGGRPPTRFAFNPRAKLVLAADFGVTHGRAAVTDLTATVLAEEVSDLDIADGPEATLGWLVDVADRLLERVGRCRDDLAGVGIGLPGPVEHDTGRPVKPPIMPGWDGFDVADWVRDRLGAPVLVDNDVNLMALGEHSVAYPQVEHPVFVKVATGIGAGIISGRQLHRGAQGSAGDLGHVQSPRGGDAARARPSSTSPDPHRRAPATAGVQPPLARPWPGPGRSARARPRDRARRAGRDRIRRRHGIRSPRRKAGGKAARAPPSRRPRSSAPWRSRGAWPHIRVTKKDPKVARGHT